MARAGYRASPVTSRPAAGGPAARVLIVGATGGTGRQLVRQALERGLAVTVLARDPSKLALDHPQLTVMRGDVLDETAVAQAD
ncbi:MAG: NAD(P)H-binding protein [Acidobacteria bacterium]|nr:NAD(P)H-binding protein [Acidobacteriota bacterium]